MNLKGSFEKMREFEPNEAQKAAIDHIEGPLLLVAGPGSGKTQVLIWRTFNLIVFHGVHPSEIFLSTFTEKAAKQLKDGLLTLLGSVHGQHYDISGMYVGTVHSLCRRILADSRFNTAGIPSPELMDEVDQYFHIYQQRFWIAVDSSESDVISQLNPFAPGTSQRHQATIALRDLFNRLSEECITPDDFSTRSQPFADMYREYLTSLTKVNKTDLSLLQKKAFERLQQNITSQSIFKHLLIDEYQDTNAVQERIYFHLAQGHKNICVVGDDDQALYRFRGATVENLVQFPNRCLTKLGLTPTRIDLLTNYRSSPQIVDFYNKFINIDKDLPSYRFNKTITPYQKSTHPAITMTSGDDEAKRSKEVASLVKKLLATGKVNDANEIAFLYPSVKSPQAKAMIDALEKRGLSVYSPRSGFFLHSEEAMLIFGLLIHVLGKPQAFGDGGKYAKFHQWLKECEKLALAEISDTDQSFRDALEIKKQELAALGLDTATDWNLLDLFYQLLALDSLTRKLAMAEMGGDEGPTCNLSLISDYLFRFQKMHNLAIVNGGFYGADGEKLRNLFFRDYLYGLYRLQESDYENNDTPFPKDRIPFLTIHQAKGLEFPVVVLGSLNPFASRVSKIETFIKGEIEENHPNHIEPTKWIAKFDAMRMFYVALSRAENLLVLVNSIDKGATDKRHSGLVSVITQMQNGIPSINRFNVNNLPDVKPPTPVLPKTYSYTADYQAYLACPRHYMLFRKYGFAPSRTRTMAFGVLVHKTIEDIHHYFIINRGQVGLPSVNFIADRIRDNYQILAQQTAHQLSSTTLKSAQEQVEQYWQKLPHIAKAVTDTEVPLTLPGQTTPTGRTYSIHGVVDLAVNDKTAPHLYDIKTHSDQTVRDNVGHYQEQLNVYAHIWKSLHGKDLTGTSIIATKLPEDGNLAGWNPLVPLNYDETNIKTTIDEFGHVVDQIENRHFNPRVVGALTLADPNTYPGKNFAQDVCSRCDGRFSCESYGLYINGHCDERQENSFTQKPIKIEQDPSKLGHVPMQPTCKDAFLEDKNVQGFIDYLVGIINGSKPIDHSYRVEAVNKHFNKHDLGKIVTFPTLRDAYDKYSWKRSNYQDNSIELNSISNKLQNALSTNNETAFYNASLDCLEWGSGDRRFKLYTANRDWLWLRKKQTALISLFNNSYTQLANTCPNLNGFRTGHYRMNSGITKIYALTYPNFIIYDSRVAAALGRLVTKYCQSLQSPLSINPDTLKFAWTGPNKRNPCINGFKFPRVNNNSVKHAESNIKANWLLQAVIAKFQDGDFWGIEKEPAKRLRALEAALFMMGYSLIAPDNGVDQPESRNHIPSNDVENDEENIPYILPLSGRGKPIHYLGNAENGIHIEWAETQFSIDAETLSALLDEFYGKEKVFLNASQTAKSQDGSLGTWVSQNIRNLSNRHASAIASVLNDLGYIESYTNGNGIYLNFRTREQYEQYNIGPTE